MKKLMRLTDKQLTDVEYAYQGVDRVLALVTEIRQSRQLLSTIGVSEASMNVRIAGLFRFEMPWAFDAGEERLSIAEVIQRHLRASKEGT